jgi:hypothetical protein
VAVLDSDVSVTDAGPGDLDYDFVGRWLLKLHFGEGERRTDFLNHRG